MSTPNRTWSVLFVAGTLTLAGCSGADSAEPPPRTATADMYSSTSFVVPFDVPAPSWISEDPADEHNQFVTWENPTVAVRILVPVVVFPPGEATPVPPPEDYLSYLLAQSDHSAHFTDQAEVEVDGHPATLVTATVDQPLDGSIGCPEPELPAPDCFGLQPDLTLRIAVIDVDGTTVLVWLRTATTATDQERQTETSRFEAMLAGLMFTDRPPTDASDFEQAGPSALDGTWTSSVTFDELAESPLRDEHELNDFNWGDFTMTFDEGEGEETLQNSSVNWLGTFVYQIDGDILTLVRDNGETFVMRWNVTATTLTLTRDDDLGPGPTPFVIKPWTMTPDA